MGLQPYQLLVVGDYLFDVQAGRSAGARTAFVRTGKSIEPPPEADIVVSDLRELLPVLPSPLCQGEDR
jgi:phosphoglycolate phosphatase-like HAD superfamily hydrolase